MVWFIECGVKHTSWCVSQCETASKIQTTFQMVWNNFFRCETKYFWKCACFHTKKYLFHTNSAWTKWISGCFFLMIVLDWFLFLQEQTKRHHHLRTCRLGAWTVKPRQSHTALLTHAELAPWGAWPGALRNKGKLQKRRGFFHFWLEETRFHDTVTKWDRRFQNQFYSIFTINTWHTQSRSHLSIT